MPTTSSLSRSLNSDRSSDCQLAAEHQMEQLLRESFRSSSRHAPCTGSCERQRSSRDDARAHARRDANARRQQARRAPARRDCRSAVCPRMSSARRRLRAPKDRQPQGPSRGCCRRRRRHRACRRRRARAAAPASTPSAPRRGPARCSASRSSIGFGPAAAMPVEVRTPRFAGIGTPLRVAPLRPSQRKARPAPARRARPTTGRPSSTSATEIDQSSRPAIRRACRRSDRRSRRARACKPRADRPRSPPRASRIRREPRQPLAQEIVDRDVGFASPASRRALVQLLSVAAERARARARRPRAPRRRARLGERASTAQMPGNGQSLHAQRRRVGAVAEFEIVRGRQRAEHVVQVAGDRHLAHRIGAVRRSRSRSPEAPRL